MAKTYNLTKNEILTILGPQWKYMGGSSRQYRNTETGRTISRRTALNMAADRLHGKTYYELTNPQRKQYKHLIDFYFQSAKEKPEHAEMDETIRDFKATDVYRKRDSLSEQQILRENPEAHAYCDTDSVVTTKKLPDSYTDDKEYGKWKMERMMKRNPKSLRPRPNQQSHKTSYHH